MRSLRRAISSGAVAVTLGVTAALTLSVVPPLSQFLAPAAAYSGTLCRGYAGCKAEGRGSAGYASNNHKMYWSMYSGHNCTNYIAYRMVRKGMPNRRPWKSYGSGNAENWGNYLRSRTNMTPRVGSIAWYRAYSSRGGSAGHVAYVEKVLSPSKVVISQDSWGSTFSWEVISKGNGWPDGFIHLRDTPLKNRERPKVSGSRRVGETLSATPGRWDPNPKVSFRWEVGGKRAGDGRTLRLTRQMIGNRVRVEAVASRLGYPRTTARSKTTGPVLPGRFSAQRGPQLSGRVKVNRTLEVSAGSWSPKPTHVSYRWSVGGDRVKGADSRRLRLRPGMVSERVAAEVTVKRRGYETRTTTVRTKREVRPARMSLHGKPRLKGTPRPGRTLRLLVGDTKPGSERSVRWLRDGKPVKGAEGRRYRLRRDDLGHRFSAQVTFRKPGYHTLRRTTGQTETVKTKPKVRSKVEDAKRGIKLRVTAAAGGRALRTTVRVQQDGKVLARKAMRRGESTLRVRGLPRGRSKIRVIVQPTDRSERYVVVRRVRN